MNHFGSLRAIDSASIHDLEAIEGIGVAKAAQIKAALEIGKRLTREEAEKKTKIRTVKDVVEYVCDYYAPYLRDKEKEFDNFDAVTSPSGLVTTTYFTRPSCFSAYSVLSFNPPFLSMCSSVFINKYER